MMSSLPFNDLATNGRDALHRLSLAFHDLMIEEPVAEAELPVALVEQEPALMITPDISEASATFSWSTSTSGSPQPLSSENQPRALEALLAATDPTLAATTELALPDYSALCTGLDSLTISTPEPDMSTVRGAELETFPNNEGAQGSSANYFRLLPECPQWNGKAEADLAPPVAGLVSTVPLWFDYTSPSLGDARAAKRHSPNGLGGEIPIYPPYNTHTDFYDTTVNVGPLIGPTVLTSSYERGLARQNFKLNPAIQVGKRAYSDDHIVENGHSRSTSSRSAKRAKTEPLSLWMKRQRRRKMLAAKAASHSPGKDSTRKSINRYQRRFMGDNERPELNSRALMIRWMLAKYEREDN